MSLVSATDSTNPVTVLPRELRSKEFLTAAEVRSVLRCSSSAVRRYLKAEQLSARRINQRRFLYTTASLLALLSTRSERHGT